MRGFGNYKPRKLLKLVLVIMFINPLIGALKPQQYDDWYTGR